MNPGQNLTGTPDVNRASGAAVGYIFGSLIILALVGVVELTISVPAIDAGHATTISSALSEIRTNENVSLNNVGWVDRSRGIVRLPISTAEQLAAQEWSNPAQARADLITRAKRASAPAPKPAATANPFE
ncbi:MAG TPA: hypothetical protein VH280_07260 [Verrucomicrobiae bacterium]|jgi:hypothetical protein|nr:hypothetical protein [Verrucomicrobiae bacterium]